MSVRQGLQIEEGVSGYSRVKNHKIYCEVTTRLWYIKIQTEVNISFLWNLSCVRKKWGLDGVESREKMQWIIGFCGVQGLSRFQIVELMKAESEEELKSLLMKVEESEKVGLKINIQKTKIMASSLIIYGK